jgi:hypothetical protein
MENAARSLARRFVLWVDLRSRTNHFPAKQRLTSVQFTTSHQAFR